LHAILSGERNWLAISLAVVHALLACACGGSGSGTAMSNSPPPVTAVPTPTPPPPPPPPPVQNPAPVCETRDVYTLCVTLQDARVDDATVSRMEELFFDVYPRLVERFNRAAPLSVYFVIGPSDHIAYVIGNTATYRADWLIQNPEDYDVVVHEVMHIVQSYSSSPGWITEGLADYVRHYYGVNNAATGWDLQMPAGFSYTNGYGVAARFFIWVEARYDIELVEALDAAARAGSYHDVFWILQTGKSLDELWAQYVANPAMPQ